MFGNGNDCIFCLPHTCHRCLAAQGRDLPDADGAWFVVLNDRFGEAIRSLIGHDRPVKALN